MRCVVPRVVQLRRLWNTQHWNNHVFVSVSTDWSARSCSHGYEERQNGSGSNIRGDANTVHLQQSGGPVNQSTVLCSFWGGARLSPLGTPATIWLIVPVPDDRWWWWMLSSRWNENWQENQSTRKKPATLSTPNPTWLVLGSKLGRRSGTPATNGLSYGTAYSSV
jgi:hypothetical protein